MNHQTSYTGNVTPNGPVNTRVLRELSITKFAVSDMANNVYLIQSRLSGARLLIDAADDASRIHAVLSAHPSNVPLQIVTTHSHDDHHQALADITAQYGATTLAGRADAAQLPIAPTRLLDDYDTIDIDDLHFEIIGLHGHTPGSIAITYREPSESANNPGRMHIFTGDSLFPGGVGRTESAENFASLFTDVTVKLFDRFPDDTWIYPGHGADTTLGVERPQLSEWAARGW